jgi:hypothetical protein
VVEGAAARRRGGGGGAMGGGAGGGCGLGGCAGALECFLFMRFSLLLPPSFFSG